MRSEPLQSRQVSSVVPSALGQPASLQHFLHSFKALAAFTLVGITLTLQLIQIVSGSGGGLPTATQHVVHLFCSFGFAELEIRPSLQLVHIIGEQSMAAGRPFALHLAAADAEDTVADTPAALSAASAAGASSKSL